MSLRPGTEFAGLQIDERIGAGGWGQVYRAFDPDLRRHVAVKTVPATDLGDLERQRRFTREGRVQAGVDHPTVLPVYRAGVERGRAYLVMRLARDGSLADLLAHGTRLSPERAVSLLSPVAEALDTVHARGVVHRDVKPGNILLEDDHVWLADFGLARPVHAEALTSQGVGVGTFDYMAPEQRRAGEVGPPADVYALGLVLYETLAGHVPDVVDRDPPPPLQLLSPAVANALHDVCARALARAPQDRFPSAGALIEAARAALTGPDMAYIAPTAPESRRRRRRWLTVAAASTALAAPALAFALAWQPVPAAGPVLSSAPPTTPFPAGSHASVAAVAPSASARTRPSVRPATAPSPPASGGAHPSPTTPAGTRYLVCADTLDLRRDPLPENQTKVLAVLTRNTAFDVTVVKDETWAYGRAGTLSGWVLRQWLKRTCP